MVWDFYHVLFSRVQSETFRSSSYFSSLDMNIRSVVENISPHFHLWGVRRFKTLKNLRYSESNVAHLFPWKPQKLQTQFNRANSQQLCTIFAHSHHH